MRPILSVTVLAAMLASTTMDSSRGDHAAAFVPHFSHAPTDPMDGVVEVELQADGTWGAAKSNSVFWRFALGVEKSPLVSVPPLGPTVNGAVTVRMQGTSPTVPCTGKICELELAGKVHWDVVTNMLVNAAMPSPKHETLDASLGDVFGSGSKFPATACQIRRQEELAKGKSLNQILSEGVTYPSKALAMMYTSGQDGSSHNWAWPSPWNSEIEVPISIRCLGNPEIAGKVDPPPPGDIASGLQVTSAMLAILPSEKTKRRVP